MNFNECLNEILNEIDIHTESVDRLIRRYELAVSQGDDESAEIMALRLVIQERNLQGAKDELTRVRSLALHESKK